MDSINTEMDVWDHVFQVNFFAPIMLARGLSDALAKGPGSIVNVTSIAGARVHEFAGTAYGTSKAALAGLTREMAADFGPLGCVSMLSLRARSNRYSLAGHRNAHDP